MYYKKNKKKCPNKNRKVYCAREFYFNFHSLVHVSIVRIAQKYICKSILQKSYLIIRKLHFAQKAFLNLCA